MLARPDRCVLALLLVVRVDYAVLCCAVLCCAVLCLRSKESTEIQEGSLKNTFFIGNYRLTRAEWWENMPNMSSEVGEIYKEYIV